MAKAGKVKVGDDVRIYWDDAALADPDGPWSHEGAVLVSTCRCKTLGTVAEITPEKVVVVQTTAEDGGYMVDFAIPKGCIKKIKVLK